MRNKCKSDFKEVLFEGPLMRKKKDKEDIKKSETFRKYTLYNSATLKSYAYS
jgi:hypothetical protein